MTLFFRIILLVTGKVAKSNNGVTDACVRVCALAYDLDNTNCVLFFPLLLQERQRRLLIMYGRHGSE